MKLELACSYVGASLTFLAKKCICQKTQWSYSKIKEGNVPQNILSAFSVMIKSDLALFILHPERTQTTPQS